jgi:hypothetical protein
MVARKNSVARLLTYYRNQADSRSFLQKNGRVKDNNIIDLFSNIYSEPINKLPRYVTRCKRSLKRWKFLLNSRKWRQ